MDYDYIFPPNLEYWLYEIERTNKCLNSKVITKFTNASWLLPDKELVSWQMMYINSCGCDESVRIMSARQVAREEYYATKMVRSRCGIRHPDFPNPYDITVWYNHTAEELREILRLKPKS